MNNNKGLSYAPREILKDMYTPRGSCRAFSHLFWTLQEVDGCPLEDQSASLTRRYSDAVAAVKKLREKQNGLLLTSRRTPSVSRSSSSLCFCSSSSLLCHVLPLSLRICSLLICFRFSAWCTYRVRVLPVHARNVNAVNDTPQCWLTGLSNRRFPEITGKDNLTVFSYSGRVKSPEWRQQLRRADLRQF